jgi:drug/metabolite transporter (DMT)-like permease
MNEIDSVAASSPSNKMLYILLILLIFAWGFSWPLSKIGLQYMPPLWFVVSRLFIGFISMMLLLIFTKRLALPPKKDIVLVLSVGFFQIGLFLVLISVGLQYVDAGRSAILAYTTSLWVTPLAVLFFGERLNFFKAVGLFLGYLGILILFSPWSFDWSNHQVIFGNVTLLVAAMSWALAMLHIRFTTWHSSPLTLIPWQLLIALLLVTLLALIVEPNPDITWNIYLWGSILYTGVCATAFGYWGVVMLSKNLPVITMSLCLLTVPIAGLFAASLVLHEPLTWTIGVAMLFILMGLAVVSLSARK